MSEIKAIILDIDDTLSPEISWISLTRDLGAPVQKHVAIYQDYKNSRISYQESKTELLELWRSTGNTNYHFFQSLFEGLPLPLKQKQLLITLVLSTMSA